MIPLKFTIQWVVEINATFFDINYFSKKYSNERQPNDLVSLAFEQDKHKSERAEQLNQYPYATV